MNAVKSVRPTAIQYKCSRAELSLHTTAADTHIQGHALTLAHVTHTHHTTLTEELGAVLGDATGWQPLSKSTFPRLPGLFLSFFLCLSLL